MWKSGKPNMSSHKRANSDIVDISIQRCLKNMVEQEPPPRDGRARLLRAVLYRTARKPSRVSMLIHLVIGEQGSELYLQRFRVAPCQPLNLGGVAWFPAHGMT